MEPNWKEHNGPGQDSGSMCPAQGSGPVRRPVDDGTRAQRPLGSSGAHRDLPYRMHPSQEPTGQYQMGGHHPQQTGYQQPWPEQETPQQQPWQSAPPDPFDGYGEDPSLAQARSENLYDRERTFWHNVEEINQPPEQQKPAPRADKHTLRWLLLIVAVVAAVGFVVYGTVFRVRSITVKGSRVIPDEEVIRLAGITEGMNTLSLDQDAIERGIESNRYLSFVCVEVQLPDQVVIQVRERTPAAVIKYCGILYIADNRGMVLEESFDTDMAHPGMVSVEGLDIRQCEVGKPLILSSTRQMDVYTSVLLELKVMSAMDQIKELDLTDMDNLFLVSTDGYSVRLGESENIHAKLRSMLLTLDKLRQDGYGVGTVDVSTPVSPTYIPEEG